MTIHKLIRSMCIRVIWVNAFAECMNLRCNSCKVCTWHLRGFGEYINLKIDSCEMYTFYILFGWTMLLLHTIKHSFSLKCDKCCLCYSMCNCDFTICKCANQTFLWFLTHLYFSSNLSWSGCLFFGLYVGSYKVWVLKMRYLQNKY